MNPDDKPRCVGRHDLFESSDPEDIAAAIHICQACPLIDPCRQERARLLADGHAPFGVWAGHYGTTVQPGLPRFTGDRNPDRIDAEEDRYDDAEAREAYRAYRKGDRSDWATAGNRVYERRRKSSQRKAVAA